MNAPLTATLVARQPAEQGYFRMGTSIDSAGRELTLDSHSLRLNGQPWVPVMGEFHYARCPVPEWREELLKMKAGGCDIVSSYVFWIHHEEIKGTWDWSGQRDLRRFVETAHEVGLRVVVRGGPWCHGEVRNGGLPDWVVRQHIRRLRTTDAKFLEPVRKLYAQISSMLSGLLWKDGGPVVGFQLDNEYDGPAEYLLALKQIARDVGLDVPLYTRTGWPSLTTPMPLGEMLPLYGGYAEGFWDRTVEPMPSCYWQEFAFRDFRTNSTVGTDVLGARDARDDGDTQKYPYLSCESGGGMADSYHRRVLIHPADVEAPAVVQIGSGNVFPGYYLFHGGTNPDGKRTTLQEQQTTAYTNWNDLPVKSYDWQAPVGEYGQLRESYHRLRRLHLFLHDFGHAHAGMATVLPDARPADHDDVTTLRWAARSDGRSGFIFINNYERLKALPAKAGVQFGLKGSSGETLTFPVQPLTIPADTIGLWPFQLDLGGTLLTYATAQPLCRIVDDDGATTFFFAETRGIAAEFAFPVGTAVSTAHSLMRSEDSLIARVTPGRDRALEITGSDAHCQPVNIVLLSEADSLAFWKATWLGRDRVLLTRAGLVVDGDAVRLTASDGSTADVALFPAPGKIITGDVTLPPTADGIFQRYRLPVEKPVSLSVAFEQVQPAGPAREIKLGPIAQPVPQAPDDADFERAAVWRIKLPTDLDLRRAPLLRFRYAGDVARITLDGRLLTDQFYNGREFELGLRRHAPEILRGELRFAVLPLRNDAPIYLAESAGPRFDAAESVAALLGVELLQSSSVTLTGDD